MTLDRRDFLRRSALGCVAFGLPALEMRRARAATSTDPVLVAIFLRGAADGLNLVVPERDRARYEQLRPTIKIPSNQLIPLSNAFGMHPGLAALRPLYDQGALAVVHATGSTHPTRSHFEAMDYMERAAPGKQAGAGWLNNTLAALGGTAGPLQGIGFPREPLALSGDRPTFSAGGLDVVGAVKGARRTALEAMFKGVAGGPAANARRAFATVDELAQVNRATGVAYPGSPFGSALKDAAALIKSGLPVRVIALELGGWDHHSDELPRMEGMARALAGGLAAFWQDLGPAERARTVALTMTEFGRTAAENGSGGTDHGHGSVMFALGGPVRGGRVVTKWPGIGAAQLNEGRDLKVTTDFRDVFAELLHRHMGLRPAQQAGIFPDFTVRAADYPGLTA